MTVPGLLIDRLVASLSGTRPPDDLARDALRQVPAEVARRLYPAPLIPAAVLVGLTACEGGWEVLMTRRTEHLRDHPGQISFPGGRLEPGDADPVAAALREAREEVGLDAAYIDVIGHLPSQAVVTGFAVSPVVALLRPGFALAPDTAEVAEIFSVPLGYLLDPVNIIWSERTVRGVTLPVCAFQYGQHHIWGATAHILNSLRERLTEHEH